jgi:addiction module HigA family antidote
MAKKLPPVHPGEVLREEFLRPMNLSPYAVARAVGVPRTRIERLANEQTAVTADTALRLGRYFGTTPAFWMGMQAQYDLERAQDEMGAELRKITSVRDVKSAA